MNAEQFASKLESRILSTCLNYSTIQCACYEAKEFGFAAVTVFPNMIEMCSEILNGTQVKLNALLSYPHGGMTIAQKADEAIDAAGRGAQGVQFVINTREVLSGNWDYIYEEMRTIKEAVPKNVLVKAVFECEYYSDDAIIHTCGAAERAGIDWIVTSTGEYCFIDENKQDIPIVTSMNDVDLILRTVGKTINVQAEGNIDHLDLAISYLEKGVNRVSSSKAAALYKAYKSEGARTHV